MNYFMFFVVVMCAFQIAGAEIPSDLRPGCSFSSVTFKGVIVATDLDDGFATSLKTPDDNLPQVHLSCQDVSARLEVSPPFRVKDENGNLSPKLAGPFRSFLIFEGNRYNNGRSVVTTANFQDRPVFVGISVENEGGILPAADTYQYQVILTVTITEP